MVIRIPIHRLVLGQYTKKMYDPDHYDLEETTCLEEITNHDSSDCPDWANPRDWYIRSKYELEWNDPETACFYERIDY